MKARLLLLMAIAASSAAWGQIFITSPSSLPGGYTNIYYTYTFTDMTSGFASPVTWSAVDPTTLPPGIAVSPNGTFSGMTNKAGTFTFQVTAQGGGFTSTQTFTLNIQTSFIQINTTGLPDGFVGQNYSMTLSASSNPAGDFWLPATLPPGLMLDSNGIISGAPTTAGTYPVTLTVEISATSISVSQTFMLTVYAGQVTINATIPLASVGAPYFYQIPVSPVSGITWTVTGPLPPGITFNFSTGALSGAPVTAGAYPFQIKGTYPNYLTAMQSFTLYVINGPLTVLQVMLPEAVQGYAYSATVAASGGLPPYQYAFATGNTNGFSIAGVTGRITGTPVNAGQIVLPLTVTDAAMETFNVNITIPVQVPLSVETTSVPNADVGVHYTTSLASNGGTQPVTWLVVGGGTGLPPGLSLSSAGVLGGTPTAVGAYSFVVQATDSGGRIATKTLQISVSVEPLNITTSSLPEGELTVAYSQTLAAADGVAPYTWTLVSGTLPAGLTLSSSGTISGKPAGPLGTSTFTVQVTDSTQPTPVTAQKAFTINIALILTITSQGPLPAGTVGVGYSQTPLIASGGATPYTWSVAVGSLPPGLQLNAATGAITGIPTAAGSKVFTVVVTDVGGQTASQQLSLTINPPGGPLTISTGNLSLTAGAAFSQTLMAAGGSPPYTWSISSGTLPAGLTLSNGVIAGTPAAGGSTSITLLVTDSQGQTANATITINVSVPPAPAVTIGSVSPIPATQPSVGLILGSPYALDITVKLTASFQSASGGNPSEVGFITSNGGPSPTVTFTIPAGTTGPLKNAPVLATGTVAGALTLTASLSAGGMDITPSPAPSETITIPPSAPMITSVHFSNTGGSLLVQVTGYSTTREMVSGAFTFAPAMGSSLSQSTVTVQLGSPFSAWYSSSASNPFGGQFLLTAPFSVSGNAADVISVSVTLTNTKGASPPASPQ